MWARLERSRSTFRPRRQPDTESQLEEATLAVLGATETGKSCLVREFLWKSGFVSEYRPTVEDFNWIEYDNGQGQQLLLQVIDAGGSRDFLAMRQLYVRTADAFLVVFAVDNESSLDEACKIVEEIREKRGGAVPVLLVANKMDKMEQEDQRVLERATGFSLEEGVPLQRVSAKAADEVEAAFREALRGLAVRGVGAVSGLRRRRQSMPSSEGAREAARLGGRRGSARREKAGNCEVQ